jgi:hypothetical protein
MSNAIIFPKSCAWFVTLGLLLSLSVSYSDDFVVPVTVTNRTAHYLHVTVNDKSFTYIAPAGSIRAEVETDGVIIKAVYSPGQNKTGAFSASYPTSRTSYGNEGDFSCHSNDSHCSSSTESRESRTPLPVDVTIFPHHLR